MTKRDRLRGCVLGLALLGAFASGSVRADGDKSRSKKVDWLRSWILRLYGDSNPTNVALTEGDMMSVADSNLGPGLEAMEADAAHETATGDGVVVAVLDGGFDLEHPAIADSVSMDGYDFVDDDEDPTDLGDDVDNDLDGIVDRTVGHGTFVAGMILEAAPDAVILPIRVRTDEGLGLNSWLVEGIDYAISVGADVINISLEIGSLNSTSVRRAVDRAVDAGIVVVVSAGNDSDDELGALAEDRDTVAVGAADADDVIAEFSNRGGDVDVFAPGVDLYGPLVGDIYGVWSGTSFAAAFVSGAAALTIEADPDAEVSDIRNTLRDSVDDLTDTAGDLVSTAGRINLSQVVR